MLHVQGVGCVCVGRKQPLRYSPLEAHDEQDDAEGGRRDWEEDPLGFDTNPGRPGAAPRHVHGVRVNAVQAARAFWCTPFVPRPVPEFI